MKVNGYNIEIYGKNIMDLTSPGNPKLKENLRNELRKRVTLLLYGLDEHLITQIRIMQ